MFLGLMQSKVDAGIVDRVIIDTYNREIERYGVKYIESAERLFYNDSLAILRFVNLIEGSEGEKYRLLFALRSINALLDDFCLPLIAKSRLLQEMQKSYFLEFGGSPVLQKQLNEKYRQHQKDIFTHMNPANDTANEIEEAVTIFNARSEMNKVIIETIKDSMGQNIEVLSKFICDLIHMSMNRLFVAKQRKYELVVYHFLEKYYASQLAIQNIDIKK